MGKIAVKRSADCTINIEYPSYHKVMCFADVIIEGIIRIGPVDVSTVERVHIHSYSSYARRFVERIQEERNRQEIIVDDLEKTRKLVVQQRR